MKDFVVSVQKLVSGEILLHVHTHVEPLFVISTLVWMCCDTAQALVSGYCDTAQALVSGYCDTTQALVFLPVSVCCDTAQALVSGYCDTAQA